MLMSFTFTEESSNQFSLGFNRFMNDIKMMLSKRAAEYYLFLTWCIAAPILLVVSRENIDRKGISV